MKNEKMVRRELGRVVKEIKRVQEELRYASDHYEKVALKLEFRELKHEYLYYKEALQEAQAI